MSQTRRHTLSVFAGVLAAGVLASCDSPTRPPTEGTIAPRIAMIRPADGTANLVGPLTDVIVTVSGGPTFKVVPLVQDGPVWKGKATGLKAGTYDVLIEGRQGTEVWYYGRMTGIVVSRGETAQPAVAFREVVSTVSAPPLPNTTNFSQRIPFLRIPDATNYLVQWSQDPTFPLAGLTELTVADTNPLITVNNTGTWHVRTRANLPGIQSTNVPFSTSRSWVVTQSPGGDGPGDPTPIVIIPGDAESVAERNLTPAKREDWFEVPVRAGDSLFIETFAARLLPFASTLNTILTLFENDGTTQIATNNDHAATTDSRIVAITPNTETVKIRVSAVGSTSGHYELAIDLKRLPAAPSSLNRSVFNGTRVDLTWNDNADNETAFAIERCLGVNCTTFVEVATTAANDSDYSDAALVQDQTYRWRVRARNAFGHSAYTSIVSANTFGPAVPSSLTATTIGENRIDLTWSDESDNETGFIIERCTGVACTVFSQVGTAGENVGTYSDLSVVFGQSYTYRVRATNNVATSASSATDEANTFPPATPTALTATVMDATRIDLAWTDNASDEQGFFIERCLGDACSNFAPIDTVGANVEAYQDNSVAFNSGYRYRVRAFHVVTGVAYTNTANADTRPPTAPTVLTATTTSGTTIDLAWTDTSDDELGFIIERCTGGACPAFAPLDTVAAGVSAVTDATALVNNTYQYRVSAIGVPGNSAVSNVATANTLVPSAPTGTSATTVSATRIDIAWSDNSNNETGFQIQRCAGVGCFDFTNNGTRPPGASSHQDSTATVGVSYSYRVRAFNIAGSSAFDATATANTFAPAAPSGFTATTISGTQVGLAWTNNAPEAVTMRIERCNTPGCSDYTEITSVSAAQSVYTDNSVTVNNTYGYRIRAQNLADVSGYATAPQVNTNLPGAPNPLAAVTAAGPQVQLSWGPASGDGITDFEIHRCSGAACTNFAFLLSVGSGTSAHTDGAVSLGNDYRYLVRAVNHIGQGVFSDTASANTRGPTAPTGLVATTMAGQIRLTWADNADNEEQVFVERCDSDGCGGFLPLETVGGTSLVQYDDATVTADMSYSYRIRVGNAIDVSAYSNTASTNTNLATAPTGLVATTVSATEIQLNWNDNALTETGYYIERCAGDGCANFDGIWTVTANETTYPDAGLTPEEAYTYRVRAVTAFGISAPSNEATATTRAPAVPSALIATTLSNTSIQLSWTDNSGNEAQFEVEQCAGAACENFVFIGASGTDVTSLNATSLTPNETYRYRVRALNTAGASAYSNIAEATTNLPAIPTALSATIVNATDLDLNWTDNATDETAYEVERCVGAGCGDGDFVVIATLGPDAVTHPMAGLTGGEYYKFRVRAQNGAGYSDYSNIVTVTAGIPAAPTGFSATTTSASQILLSWTDASNNEGSFVVERCEGVACSGIDFSMLSGVPANQTTFQDNAVAPNTTYRYRVLAENAAGPSPYSNEDDANTNMPDVPTSLVATTILSTQVDLSWNDGGPYEMSTEIERCSGVACVNFVNIGSVSPDVVNYTDAGLQAGLFYRYRVRTTNAVGQSAYSNIAEAETNLPAAPTALSVVAMSATQIDLTWTDNATNETDYSVERCDFTGCGTNDFVVIDLLGPDATFYSDPNVLADSTYSYRVVAANTAGASGYSNIASTNTFAPAPPTALTATTMSGGQIDLAWTENANNELSIDVERCEGNGCSTFSVLVTLPPNANSYQDFVVTTDQSYTYQVRAHNNVASSAYTNTSTADTYLPAAPSGIMATTIASDQINVTWIDNATNELGYRVERCVGISCLDFDIFAILPAGSALFQDTGLDGGESYSYQVSAYNISGISATDGPVTATTLVPAAPTDLVATVISASVINLNWTDNADNELGYRIERCSGVGCSNFVEVTTANADETFKSIGGHSISQRYKFRVRAYNAAGVSTYSNVVDAITFLPTAPTALTATTEFKDKINLGWSDNAGNEDGYSLERCIGNACVNFAEIAALPPNTNFHADNAVPVGVIARYRVRAFNGVGNSAYSAIAEDNTVVPATPTNLSGVANGQTQINLDWTDNATDESAYWLERCAGEDCVDFAEITSLPANTTAFSDLTVSASTVYRYRLRAEGNGLSDYSNIVRVTTILPADPTGLSAVAVSDGRIDLSWTDNADNEVHYLVLRCVGGAGCGSYVTIAELDPNVTTYSDLTAAQNTQYAYQVVATNGAGSSQLSNEALAETNIPGLPTALTATTVTAIRVDLAWTDNANNETGYYIERCTGAACVNFVVTDSVAADVTVHFDSTLTFSTSYRYRVRAFNANGSSGYSNIASAATNAPSAPSNLAATVINAGRIDLTWTDNSDNEATFEIERCDGVDCTSFGAPVVVGADQTSYSDLTTVVGTSYTYRVRGINAAGVSLYSDEVTANTFTPAAPSALAATTASASQIDLTWTDNANNENSIAIERCVGVSCTVFSPLTTVGANSTGYSDTGLSANESYTYKVYAQNQNGASGFSGEATATTNLPAPPTALSATLVNAGRIDLAWTDNATSELAFRIERCTGDLCSDFTELATVSTVDLVSYSDETTVVGTSYTYRVRTENAAGISDFSNETTATTFLPAQPSISTLAAFDPTTTRLDWAIVPNSVGYKIEKCVIGSCSWTEIADLGNAVTEHFDTVTTGVTYGYRMYAYNNAGLSDVSMEMFVSMNPPAAASGVSAIATSSTQTEVTWVDNSTDEQGFRVERCDGAGCTFGEIVIVAAGETSYVDAGLTEGEEYTYRITAFNAVGNGAGSNEFLVSLKSPTAPSSLVATTTGPGEIALIWSDNSVDETAFSIERCGGAGCDGFVQVATVGANVSNYQDTGLGLNVVWRYQVRALNNIGPSGYSNIDQANTILPVAASDLVATPVHGERIDISWTDNSPNNAGFRIERCIGGGCGGGDFLPVTNVGPNAVSFVDNANGVAFGNIYSYRVIAFNISGDGAPSNVATASTVLNAPSQLKASLITRTHLRLTWVDNSNIEVLGQQVERCAGFACTPETLVATPAENATLQEDAGLAEGTEYSYRVRAVTIGGYSDWSNIAVGRTPITLASAVAATGLTDVSAGERNFVMNVPGGALGLRVTQSGGGGDPDLYVKYATPPTAHVVINDAQNCVPYVGGTNETCTFTSPTPGDWFTMVHGYSPYSGTQVKMSLAERFGQDVNFSTGGTGMPSGYIVAQPYTLTAQMSATHLGMFLEGVSTGTSNVRFAIYNNRVGVGGNEPNLLLAQFTGLLGVGLTEVAIAELQLAPGVYWFAILPENTVYPSFNSGAGVVPWKYLYSVNGVSYAGGFPGSWPVTSNTTSYYNMSFFGRGFR